MNSLAGWMLKVAGYVIGAISLVVMVWYFLPLILFPISWWLPDALWMPTFTDLLLAMLGMLMCWIFVTLGDWIRSPAVSKG